MVSDGHTATSTERGGDLPLYPPAVEAPDGPLTLWQFLRQFPKNPLRGVPKQAYHDDIFVYGIGSIVYVWVTGPEFVEQVLVRHAADTVKTPQEKRVFGRMVNNSVLTADHDDWRWQRRALAPLFRHADLLAHVPAMATAARSLTERWAAAGPGTRAIDKDMTDVTFDVLLTTLLTGSKPSEAASIIEAGERYLLKSPWELTAALLGLPRWVPHPGSWTMARAAADMRKAVGAIVDRRTAAGPGSAEAATDLLGRLIAARDPETGQPMTRDLVIDNLATLLEAGHETTAKATTWTLYLLARATAWQERVREEVRAVVGDGPVRPEHVAGLEVTTRVLKESMRLYPPAPVLARLVVNPFQLGAHRFEKGTQLVMPLYCIHRHRKYWDDPDRFDPDRFLPARTEGMPRTQYMPFGAGPRICIGQSFAMIEAVTLLATFVRAARFDWDGSHLPEPISRVTLRPSGGMPLRVAPLR